jgi:hypothetical protein
MTAMKMLGRTIGMVFFLATAGIGFAGPFKTFSSGQFGYSLEYPEAWYFKDGGEQVDIFSAAGGYEVEGEAGGMSILVEALSLQDEGRADKALERIIHEKDEGMTLGEFSTRGIGGRDWRMTTYHDEEHGIDGELYALVKGVRVYLIGTFYKPAEARSRFQPVVDGVLSSFKFAPVKYKTYQDANRGISFKYPDSAAVDDRGTELRLIFAGEDIDAAGLGAAVSLGAFAGDEEDIKNLDEKGMFAYLKKMNEDIQILEEPAPATLAKTGWVRGVFSMRDGKVVIYLKKAGVEFFAIVFLVRPPEAERDFEEMIETFQKTLTIDFKKWAASLNRKD